jgi:hypothetical protein
MASQILATASHVADKAKEMTGVKNAKVAQLAADTKDVHDPSHRITSDYGVKQNNTDDWLGVATGDKQGPMLLEDTFAREKVCQTPGGNIKCSKLIIADSSLRSRAYSRACCPCSWLRCLWKVHTLRVCFRCHIGRRAYRYISRNTCLPKILNRPW